MEEGDKDQEDDHEDDWANGLGDTEETDHADDCQVNAGGGLLESPRINKPLGIDIRVVNEQQIVPVGQIDQEQPDGGKS